MLQELNVYAELEGRTVLATKTGQDSYQVNVAHYRFVDRYS